MADTSTLRERIQAARALAEAATPGPWEADHDGDGAGVWIGGEFANTHDGNTPDDHATPMRYEDARFIAANDPATALARCDADLVLLDKVHHASWCRTSHNDCCGPSDCDCDAAHILTNVSRRYPQ